MKASKFSIGDKVRVIRARGGSGLTEGEIVTVTTAGVDRYEPRVYVNGMTNSDCGYDDSRFELVTAVSTIEVGSKVRITNDKSANHDPDGMGPGKQWRNCWISEMREKAGNGVIYTVRSIDQHGVKLEEHTCGYPLTALELVPETIPNGVDGNGQPIKFETKDLKTLQRVVFRNGEDGIVSVVNNGFLRVVKRGNSHVKARMSYELERIGYGPAHDITEVYDLPEEAEEAFDYDSRGKLLFKATDPAKQAALKVADEAIAKAKAELDKAEAARKALD